MVTTTIEVKTVPRIEKDQLAELHGLFAQQWWTKARRQGDVMRMVANTDLFVTAVDVETRRLHGFARLLTDFTYLALLLDVIVDERVRGQGVGSRLMEAVVTAPALRDVSSLELVCQPEQEAFYARWGFTARVGGSRLMRRTLDPLLLDS